MILMLHLPDIVCSKPPQIPNAHLQTSSTNIGNVSTYVCEAGYGVTLEGSIERGFNITCLLDADRKSAHWTVAAQCEGNRQQVGQLLIVQ